MTNLSSSDASAFVETAEFWRETPEPVFGAGSFSFANVQPCSGSGDSELLTSTVSSLRSLT
jgi:hypothetical protein